ncbi:unnamed protein product, partial [Amoebophrya sp. A120]
RQALCDLQQRRFLSAASGGDSLVESRIRNAAEQQGQQAQNETSPPLHPFPANVTASLTRVVSLPTEIAPARELVAPISRRLVVESRENLIAVQQQAVGQSSGNNLFRTRSGRTPATSSRANKSPSAFGSYARTRRGTRNHQDHQKI